MNILFLTLIDFNTIDVHVLEILREKAKECFPDLSAGLHRFLSELLKLRKCLNKSRIGK